MNRLITGGAGSIGSSLIQHALVASQIGSGNIPAQTQ
jgi:FlaA1/EpsC-like NDP-sugar epimerase